MLLPPIATLVDDHSSPDSLESMDLDTQQMDDDTRPPIMEGPTLGNSLGTLTTLVEFYHFERRWINQQRSSLQDDPGLDPVCQETNDSSVSSSSLSLHEPSRFMLVKAESEDPVCISDSSSKSRESSTLRFSRWPWSTREQSESKPGARSSRQSGFNEPRLILPPAGQRPGFSAEDVSPSLEISETESPSDQTILDLFENMMESRLESCQRIDKLVRRAHGRQVDIDHGGFTRSIGGRRMVCTSF
ncbi:hypothetical protein F5880DRAFT_926332 [Lentinula raphanica]|nr:hypothetical protein EV360DRAFT_78164 [Lentinula raphanica]KAJ3828409.1 hypothetical protein F5880DRAFT_926332 [Lentinula raphanica]